MVIWIRSGIVSLNKRYVVCYRAILCWRGQRCYHLLDKMPEQEAHSCLHRPKETMALVERGLRDVRRHQN